ncbi:MAG: DUF4445 domain-containing protein [Anaerolineae bacterium]|nr:DUF4445 domain-containing protein [Anaerolineae bacterium]
MAKYTVNFQPIGRRVEVEAGVTLLDAAQQAGIGLSAVCGGAGVCDTCLVYVREGRVSPPNLVEEADLDADDLAAGLRLACQTEVLGDLRVEVPPGSLSAPQRTQVEGEMLDVAVEPAVTKHVVRLEPATQEDLRSDWSRLCDALAGGVTRPLRASVPVLAALSPRLRAQGWQASVMVRAGADGCEVVRVGAPDDAPLGFAVDIGTTKLAGYLVDLATGRTLAMQGRMNPQIAYGEDVMARIGYAQQSDAHAQTMQRVLVDALNEMIAQLCAEAGAGAEPSHVVDVAAVANTAMHHLFVGLPVQQLGSAPYVAAFSDALNVRAAELGLDVAPGAYVYMPPNIAGFVGADHVSMLLATDIPSSSGVVVGLDIGTNTEVTLNAGGRLLSCSTASGPAFEGAHIRDGMRASDGAIEVFRMIDDRPQYQTIGHAPPVGVCGSGILDMVAELRKAGVLSISGAMRADAHPRVVRLDGHGPAFLVAANGETGHSADIFVTRGDVSEIQLAKSAMRAGVKILLEEAGLTEDDIESFIIAGAFGSYIDVDSAVAIGMFPPLPRDRYKQVGNAAGMGARQCLVSRSERARGEAIARRVRYLELTNDPRFTDRFSQAVLLEPVPWG